MRIPFDLIAAILFIDRFGSTLDEAVPTFGPLHTLGAWGAFLFFAWLFHDLAARLTEARTSHGRHPDGGGRGLHPQQFHTRCVIAAQILTVALFVATVWHLNWPAMVVRWPEWLGFKYGATVGRLELAHSLFMGTMIAIAPYLAAMLLSWVPRRRLASGARRRMIPLIPYLSFEAKLSWLPLSLCAGVALVTDGAHMLPAAWTTWLDSDAAQAGLLAAALVLGVVIFVPLAAIKLWKCEELPDGELKQRLQNLLERSGVKARAVLVWGGRGTGILNACVLGPWSRFRYVLISPLLADELSPEETEAVLGHELGHARYGHLTFYFVIVLCMVALMGIFSLLPLALHGPLSGYLGRGWKTPVLVEEGLTLGFMIAYMYFFFGALSRRCEREADLASAELMGTPQPLVTALEKIAWMNGNMRRVPCWHHGSIAERVEAVQNLSADPDAMRKFHARQKKMRILLTALTAALLAAQLVLHTGAATP